MSVAKLKRCIKRHGKAKTAVALGLKDTNAISNWVARDTIPEKYRDDVNKLPRLKTVIARFNIPKDEM